MILRERVADDNLIVCWRGFNAKLQGGVHRAVKVF